MSSPQTQTTQLLFHVGPVPCCVDSVTVVMIIDPPSHITALPGSNGSRPGVFEYNKNAVRLYDIRIKFGLPADQRGKIIIADINNRRFGFWVDRIADVIDSSLGRWAPLPVELPRTLFDAVLMYREDMLFHSTFAALAQNQVCTRLQSYIQKLVVAEQLRLSEPETAKKPKPELSRKQHKPAVAEDSDSGISTRLSVQADRAAVQKPQRQRHQDNKPQRQDTPSASRPVTARPHNSEIKSADRLNQHQTDKSGSSTQLTKKHSPKESQPLSNTQPTVMRPTTKTTPVIDKQQATMPAQPRQVTIQTRSQVTRTYDQDSAHNWRTDQKENNNPAEDDTSSTGLWIIALFCLLITGLLYYLWPELTSEQIRPAERPQRVETQIMQTMDEDIASDSVTAQPADVQIEDREKPVTKSLPDDTPQTLREPDTDEREDYTAAISQQSDLITIVIEGPDAKLNIAAPRTPAQIPGTSIPVESSTHEPAEETVITAIDEALLEQKTSSTQTGVDITQREIIHIVVKGDTLWHIAKRYVHNPFKYNELARLSRIKNPDLIYPGNRVRIIVINSNKPPSAGNHR